jgi:hypothetical protein
MNHIDLEGVLVAALAEMEDGLDPFTRHERRARHKHFHTQLLPEMVNRLMSASPEDLPTLIVSLRSYGQDDACAEAKRQNPVIWFEEKEALYKVFLDAIGHPPGQADWAVMFLLIAFRSIVLEHVTRRLNPDATLMRPPSAFVYSMQ